MCTILAGLQMGYATVEFLADLISEMQSELLQLSLVRREASGQTEFKVRWLG